MSRRLDDLTPKLRVKAFELIARAAEAGIPLFITDTLRTLEEHKENLRKGRSWVVHSKHLAGRDGLSRAIDVVPYEIYTSAPKGDKLLWDASHPHWQAVGKIGEELGLGWGGRWRRKDMGHFSIS